MGHFTPTYKFSDKDILVNSYAGMSEHDQIIRSFQQGNLTDAKYLNEIIKNSEEQFKEKLKSDRELSGNQINAIKKLADGNAHIENALNQGFSSLSNSLNSLSGQLEIQQSALLEQYKLSNCSLNEISEYIKIPEFEKERLFYIQTALKFLSEVFVSPERYKDALSNFLKANAINDTDYIISYQIGLIYLYGEDMINLIEAEKYFKKAYSYAYSAGKIDEASNSANHLAYTYLLMGQFQKSVEAADMGLKLRNISELKMIKAEALMLMSKMTESIETLNSLSENDYRLIIQAENNSIFDNEIFHKFIEEYKEKLNSKIDKLAFEIENMDPTNSKYYDRFIKINSSISKKNVSIETLINAINEFKNILDLVRYEIAGKNERFNRVKSSINSHINNLTDEQYKYLIELLNTNPAKASIELEKCLLHNEDIIISQKSKGISKDSFILFTCNGFLIFGIVGAIYMLYLNLTADKPFWISLLFTVIPFIWCRAASKYSLYGEIQKKIAGWAIAILLVAKLYFDVIGI